MTPNEVRWIRSKLLGTREEPATPWYDTSEEGGSLTYGHISLTKVGREMLSMATAAPVLRQKLEKMTLPEGQIEVSSTNPYSRMLSDKSAHRIWNDRQKV